VQIIRAIMPREDRFFDLFQSHADLLVRSADALTRLFAGASVQDTSDEIHALEKAADDVTRDVLLAVRRSFITPFDRSAIAGLISAMDDALDEMWQTAKAVRLYGRSEFEPQMQATVVLAAEAARLVAEAIPLLRKVGRHGPRLHAITERIVELEGQADDLHEEGIRALFEASHPDGAMTFIVGRELFRHVERLLDRLEDVADEIQGIVIDHS
jgi:predicted phosphate transport protein (TIGR00153 family)